MLPTAPVGVALGHQPTVLDAENDPLRPARIRRRAWACRELDRRADENVREGKVQYLLAPRKERALTVRFPPKLAQKVLAVAAEDDVPVRAFTYTALLFYAVAERLIPPIQIVQSVVATDEDESRDVHKFVFETGPRAKTRKA
jgi:hypothetical protein